jgi:(S)-2-hydroxyglutarate dehydrogenase
LHRYDAVVVGAGIVGLATAMKLVERHPRLRLAVLDKEPVIGAHQTGHNSAVLHRGVYYAPGSLKARLCVAGSEELVRFCEANQIAVERCGKVIVAVDDAELPALAELERRGRANGVPGLERIGPERLLELEPHVAGRAALYSPQTGVVDFRRVAEAYADVISEAGGEIRFRHGVRAIRRSGGALRLETDGGDVETRHLITCAGLHSDRVAAMSDPQADRSLRIVPFRGDFYVLRPERRHLARNLVYPVPDTRFPFLGVHFTRRPDGEVWAGPNAVLAFAREGYRRTDVAWRDLHDAVGYRGFWRMAARYWRVGSAELYRDLVKGAFVAALRRYVPELSADDLLPGPSGVRAQAVRLDGHLVDDFVVQVAEAGRAIHVRNAPSPAATASLAIGSLIADEADRVFDLGVSSAA